MKHENLMRSEHLTMTNVKNVQYSEMWHNVWFGREDPPERLRTMLRSVASFILVYLTTLLIVKIKQNSLKGTPVSNKLETM
jgi:hypothetical protein